MGVRRGKKGGRKKFTDFKTLKAEAESIKESKQREADGEDYSSAEDSDSGSDSSSSSSSSSGRGREKERKAKGVEGLIEVNNPNVGNQRKNVKARDADANAAVTLTRREREALEAQRAKERYFKLQAQGKTEQARRDLERLAIIRKQREEAAKKRTEEKAKKDAAKARK